MSAAILFLVFVGTVWYTVKPLFISIKRVNPDLEINIENAKLNNIFSQIKETEFEYEMGILENEDYKRIQNELKTEASTLLNKLPDKQIINNNLKTCNFCENNILNQHKFCSQCGKPIEINKCKICDHILKKNHKFCSQCGEKSHLTITIK